MKRKIAVTALLSVAVMSSSICGRAQSHEVTATGRSEIPLIGVDSASMRMSDGHSKTNIRRHEFSAGTGIVPGRYSFGYDHTSPFDQSSLPGVYEMSRYYEREYVSGVWSLGYTYNFTRVISLQANLFYEAGWIDRYSRETRLKVAESFDSYLSAMASFRVNWFNRPAVRMYSYFGLGLSYNHTYNDPIEGLGQGQRFNAVKVAFQFTPIGVMYGGRFFGFAEIGAGHYFCGLALGAGYRF